MQLLFIKNMAAITQKKYENNRQPEGRLPQYGRDVVVDTFLSFSVNFVIGLRILF